MLLNYFSLSKILIALVVSFVFIKIYQHNLVIKLNYEKQRLEKRKIALENEKNDLLVELLILQEPEQLRAKAKDAWGMKAIAPRQVKVVPVLAEVDFLGTMSCDAVLKKLGIYDLIMGYTGRYHAGT